MKNKIWIVGMGPGDELQMTQYALQVLKNADVIIGYTVYLELLPQWCQGKKLLSTPMRQEEKRCQLCFEEAQLGQRVVIVCSGDAGVYGMASLMYEIGASYPETELEVVPGITAANSGAAMLGAPLNHDYCVISLSDLMTPWETIERRLMMAARGDFAIALYNPSSHKRKDYLERACTILLHEIEGQRPCGYIRNIGREGTIITTCTLDELKNTQVDMYTTVFIGNSQTKIQNGRLITPRGYQAEK